MAELLTCRTMPGWLRKAVRKGALTWAEAQAIWFNQLMAPPELEWVPLPPALCEDEDQDEAPAASEPAPVADEPAVLPRRVLDRHRPAAVVVELGGNDALRGLDLNATRGNLDRIVGASREAGAGWP